MIFSRVGQTCHCTIYIIIDMKLQEITQSLILAFELERVASRIHSQHFLELKKKNKQKQALDLSYILSEDGRPIIELFGYHLANKLGDRSFFEMGKTLLQVLVTQADFVKYCETVWPDMGRYERVLPVLFRILKANNLIPLRTLDLYIEQFQICHKQLNPFIVELKQSVPAYQLKRLRQRLVEQCERQDLLNTGYAQKIFLQEIIKKQLKINIPEWPKQLYHPNSPSEINYRLLLGHQYLNAGESIFNFIRSMFVKKIVRALKKAGQQKKTKNKKSKNKSGKLVKPGDKGNKHEKLFQKYIEANKPKKTDEINRNQFMIKSIVQDIISSVVELKYDEGFDDLPKATKVMKSVYITEPEFPQIQYDVLGLEINKVKFVGNNGLGLFVSGDKGFIMDNIKSTKKSEFQLNLSSVFKQSPIIEYQILDNVLYLLKQNGLLYSWPVTGETFLHQIQTSFVKPCSPPDAGTCNYLKIKDGTVIVNCTHNAYSRLQIYSLQLHYIGVIELNQSQYNLSYKICEEARNLLRNIREVLLDKKINSQAEYKQLFKDRSFPDSNFNIGTMLCNAYASFSVRKINQYANWILSFRQFNKLGFPSWVAAKFKQNPKDSELSAYLLRLGYINEGSEQEIRNLLSNSVLSLVGNRKTQLICLYQDNNLEPIKSPFISKQQFLTWIAPACLMKLELKQLAQSLQYRPDGKVDMSKLYYNQHYKRLSDAKYSRFNPEKYKYLEVPPVCIKQFLPIPAYQTLVFTLCFPLNSCFYVVNMLNGDLLNKFDVTKMSSLPPKIRQCQKNGYIFMIAHRSVSLWNTITLSTKKQLNPIKNWIDLESNQIVDLVVLYELSTVVTLTNDCIKIWDFDQMCKKKHFTNIFQLKPGYKAIENQGGAVGQAKNYKKKILLREAAISLFYFVSPNQSIIAGAVSLTKNKKYYIKCFTVNKFKVAISSAKEHYQIPTKLLRELQSMAYKRKNLAPVIKDRWLNPAEKVMQNRMAQLFKKKLKSVSEVKVRSTLKPELQQKISILSHSLSTIYNRSMFKDNNESKRIQNIFKIITVPNMSALQQILQPKFLALYTLNDKLGYDLDRMLQDCMSTKQKKSINRVLYVLSLIQKYSRTLVQAGTKVAKLISQDRSTLDQNCVLSLFPKPLPLDPRIITKVIKLINSLPQPLPAVTKIINSYLPTRYRFLVPRYIKQIYTGKQSAELNQYISNHYESEPTTQEIISKLKQNKKQSIQQYLEQNNLLNYVHKQVVEMFPLALNCNYSLIQALMCLKIINEDQAYHYCVRESIHPGERMSSRLSLASAGNEEYLDQINQRIQNTITNKKIRIPYPKVTFAFFKKQLYDGPNGQKFFFEFLQADRNQQEILSEKLEIAIKMVKKQLCLRYRIDQWRWMMGENIKILKPYLNDFLERFPVDFRIVSVSDLKTALMSLIQDQNVYQQLIKRIAYSCTSSVQKKEQWRKTSGVGLQTEGMWVNINHLLRFMEDYNPLLLDLEDYSQQKRNYIIKLPAYAILNKLFGDFSLLSITKFRQLLTLNLHPLTISDVEAILQNYFKYGNKKINIFELKEHMPQDYSIFGMYLIQKYHRLDFQHRFTIINGSINSSQLVQLFNSKIITNYLFGDKEKGLSEFLPFEEIIHALKKYLLQPAATRMANSFSLALQPQLIELIEHHLSKTSSIPVLLLSQLLHNVHNEQPIIMCLLKHMTGESNSAQLINLNTLLTFIRNIKELNQPKHTSYVSKLKQKTQNKNVVQLFLEQAQPQNFPFTDEDHPKSYLLTYQHMNYILGEQFDWFINFKPYANIRQFIDHIRANQRAQEQLLKTINLFTQNCVCRVGINQVANVMGQNCSFPDFYYKIRSSFKIMAKIDTKSFLSLYNAIVSSSPTKTCDINGIRNLCQQHISVNRKMQWICALYDRQRITNPLQQQELTLQNELKIEKLKNIYDHKNLQTRQVSKQALKNSLNYHKYLAHKYLSNDPTKMKQIHQCMMEKKTEQAKNMLQVYGVINTIHLDELIKYFGEEYHHQEKKFGDDPSFEQIKSVINLVKDNTQYLNNTINNPAINDPKQQQLADTIKLTTIYNQFVTNGAGEYYCTYHSILTYCESLLQSKLTTHTQILKIQAKIRDFLIRRDMTPAKIYDLLDLSTSENILRYLPEVVMYGSQTKEQMRDIGIVVSELARAERINVKYPINAHQFINLLSDLSSKSQRDRKQYQSLYSDLDILGTGYVNLNDVPKFRGKYPAFVNPYVHIPIYIDFLSQKAKDQQYALPTKYLGPILDPPQDKELRTAIKQKLLKYELPVRSWQKTKLIKVDICLAVMGQFGIGQNHQYQQFLKQKFILQSNNLLDLSGVIDWLMESLIEERQETTKKQLMDQKATKVQKLINQIQERGGLYSFINYMRSQPKHVLQQFFANLIDINENNKTQLLILGGVLGFEKIDHATTTLKNLAQKYFREVKKWDTFNNHFCREVKNMAQMYYSLVFKFYYAHSGWDMHKIYQNVSDNGELTLLTLWRYIEDKGITGYSRADINELFSAIDINSDKRLSYLQFCQFWMACEQLFANENIQQYEIVLKIDQINREVKDVFLELCCVELDNYQDQVLNIGELVKFMNIPNVEKVDYIVRAVNCASVSRGPTSGAFDTKIIMNKSKLKIMMDKMKFNQANDLENLRQDLIVIATQPEIHGYAREGYNADSMKKIILMKYPILGYQIAQHLYDLCQLQPIALAELYQKCVSKQIQPTHQKESRQGYIQQLVMSIEECYRKHPLKTTSYNHKQFGASIASGLLAEQVLTQVRSIGREVNQIYNFLNKIQMPTVPLYYQLDQFDNYFYPENQTKLVAYTPQQLQQYSHTLAFNGYRHSLYTMQSVLFSKKPIKLGLPSKGEIVMYRQIQWLDTDIVCKSDNKVNLLLHANLYCDPEISLIPINIPLSNRFKIQGAHQYRPQYQPLINMSPIISSNDDRDQLMDRVMSLMKHIGDKLTYCYFKHGVSGLLVDRKNVLVSSKNNCDIKFDNFVSGFGLNVTAIKNKDQTVNYVEGIDPKYILSGDQICPPEARLGTLTQAIDIYLLAHIVYNIFKQQLNPSTATKTNTRQQSCEQETIWEWSSQLHQISAAALNMREQGKMSEKEYNVWVLLYECSEHDWFMRPRLHQLMQVIDNYFQLPSANLYNQLFVLTTAKEEVLQLLLNNRITDALQITQTILPSQWSLAELIELKKSIPITSPMDTKLIDYYNKVLQSYIANDNLNEDPETILQFLTNAVDYVLKIPVTSGGQCFIVNGCYKNILNHNRIGRYLSWCDDNWRIEQYQISKKIEKINMKDKLEALHKNSSYYHDIATLVECRVTLSQSEPAKRSQTSKKVAISFIHSCLISNNINKIYAVYRSQILSNIYCSLTKQELQPHIIAIFEIATSCFNPTLAINRFRAVDEVYRVMMVITNSIKVAETKTPTTVKTNTTGRSKFNASTKQIQNQSQVHQYAKGENQSVVSMQDFVNNYYTLSGQECRQIVLVQICRDHLCTLPVLTYLMNEIDVNKIANIILNLSYDQASEKILRSPVVGGYINKLKQAKMDTLISKIKQATTLHTECLSLGDLSTAPFQQQTYAQLLKQHLKYYAWYCELSRKNGGPGIFVNYQRNFYNHFQSLIAKSQRIYETQIDYVQNNQSSLQIVRLIIKIHRVMFEIYTKLPCHPDFTAGTLRFLMKSLQNLYQNDNIYVKSKINSEVAPDILYILRRFWGYEPSINCHDLIQIAIANGFIQFYCRIIKKQHALMQKYIEKNVQNIHMTDNYHPEAQFRLICFYLFIQNKEHATQISQVLIANHLPSYIVDTMLHSSLALDLRFYKANNELVPFRYCHPLRAQSIAMIGYTLTSNDCILKDDIASRLVPYLPDEMKNVGCENLESLPQKMRWVESLWLFANITGCQNQRLKYEFLNLRLHAMISSQIAKYPFLNRFFPEMTQTLRNSQSMISSLARSQIK